MLTVVTAEAGTPWKRQRPCIPVLGRVAGLRRVLRTMVRTTWTWVWICVAGVPGTAWSHQWYIQPSVLMQTYYNDNLRLNPGPHAALWGAIGDVSAKLGVRSQVSGLSLTPQLRDYRYVGYSGANGYDHLARTVNMAAFYQTQTDAWNVNATYDHDSTLTSELLDSGRVNFNIPRETLNLQQSWVSEWTPRASIQVDAGYTRTSHNNGLVYGLRDYRVINAGATLEYKLTHRQSLTATASGSRYTAPAYFDDRTDSYVVRGGWVSHWTERTVTSAGGGLLINRTRLNIFGVPLKSTRHGYVLHANASTASERTTWSADLSRNVDPTSFGVLMQRDQASAKVTRGLTPYMDGSIDGLWLHSKTLQNSLETIDRSLEQVELKLKWRYAAHWALDGGYRWTRQDYGHGAGQSNVVFLNLRYTGLKRFVSY